MPHSKKHNNQNENSYKGLRINNIPVKKNDRKPVSRKKQAVEESNVAIEGIEKVLIVALSKNPETDSQAIEDQSAPASKKQPSYKADRSKMWQQEIKTKALELKPRCRSRKSLEDKWSAPTKKNEQAGGHKILYSVCTILGLMILLGLWFTFQSLANSTNDKRELAFSEQGTLKTVDKISLGTQIKEITKIIEDYLSAETVDEKCRHIYKADEYRSEIESYYQQHGGLKAINDFKIDGIKPVLFDSKEYWQVVISNTRELHKIIYLRNSSNKSFKVDWKADVVFQANDIASFIASNTEEPTMFRFNIEISVVRPVYNWGFTEDKYFSVNLSVPGTDKYLWGYVKKGSELHERFLRLNRETESYRFASSSKSESILKIRFLKDSPTENKQYVLIDEIISSSWVNIKE